ncbi:hypothetical protein [Cellulomonas pakistanensis]|uniref:Uncharacterized protein n=1 Tax=Cellulomonas pakistanensis TaxID=992287 RepID=A0A919PAJ9_9CELL|nr:hypothetical protein [Cellulomonas pakistanensis]GIG34742.1 hypothetical protein Cpa01nite_01230 [Cellulomonas pakistanensis]
MADYIWGDASVTYDDWHGTAQLDERMTGRLLNKLVGLDAEDWWIVGLDIGGGERVHELRVLAVHRDVVPEGGDVLRKIAAANDGEIPVTSFLIHDVDPYAVLRAMTHSFDLRLRRRGTVGLPVRVQRLADVPEQH